MHVSPKFRRILFWHCCCRILEHSQLCFKVFPSGTANAFSPIYRCINTYPHFRKFGYLIVENLSTWVSRPSSALPSFCSWQFLFQYSRVLINQLLITRWNCLSVLYLFPYRIHGLALESNWSCDFFAGPWIQMFNSEWF